MLRPSSDAREWIALKPASLPSGEAIDTLKERVPIWKQEHWSGGSDWALEQHSIRPVAPA